MGWRPGSHPPTRPPIGRCPRRKRSCRDSSGSRRHHNRHPFLLVLPWLRRSLHHIGYTSLISTWLHDRRRAHLRRPGSGPAGTASPRLTGMEAVGFSDPIRHTRSQVRYRNPPPHRFCTPIPLMNLLLVLFPFLNLSFLILMGITHGFGVTDVKCFSRSTRLASN